MESPRGARRSAFVFHAQIRQAKRGFQNTPVRKYTWSHGGDEAWHYGFGFKRMSAEATGRQYVEAVLSDGEASFQAIFAHAAIGIAQIGLDQSWMRVNSRFCQMLGYSEAELRTKKLGEITHPDHAEESRAGRRQLLAGEISSHTMEKRYIRKDGSVFWGRLNRSLVRDQDDHPKYIIAILEDVTQRIDAEQELRDSKQRLTLAQNAAHLGMCEWDLRTNLFTYSEEYARLYGLAPNHSPLTVDEVPKHIHPDDRERLQASIWNALERTHAWDTEYRVQWPDGSVHWLNSKGAVLLDASGRPYRSTGVTLDITERKRAEAELATNRDEIRALAARLVTAQEEERRRLSRDVHDQICQDLASIAIELGGCAAKPPRREDLVAKFKALQHRVVQAAHEAHNIALRLHSPILDDLGLVNALRDLCRQFSGRAPGVAFKFKSCALPESIPPEVASSVFRVAQESLRNAAKHSCAKQGSVALTWQDRTIMLTITDDGIGFDPQRARENGGLGLIGMEESARSVSGKLTIAAQPGSGTRIALEVPLPLTG
jgi:PAS domain S-box-containing protein